MTCASLPKVIVVERRRLYHERYAYCAHPHMTVAADGAFLLVFNRAPRRDLVLHPPQDPEYRNVLMRSADEGRTWSAPWVVPDYRWSGVECAGLTRLRSGRFLLYQWQCVWLPLPLARRSARSDLVEADVLMRDLATSPELDEFARSLPATYPWARGGGRTAVHRSDDGGRTFSTTAILDTAPFSGGYGMRGAIELSDGEILLPLSDVPNYRVVFAVRSRNGGVSWSRAALVAESAGHEFEEPIGRLLPSGRILLLLRDNASRLLHEVHSDDAGGTWSSPRSTGISAYPADLAVLPDGRIACVAGRRQPPFGIVMHFSSDDGVSWDPEPQFLVDDLPTKDLGYPTLAMRSNGDLFIVYYARDEQGVTGLECLLVQPS